jgi:hypothetical protein
VHREPAVAREQVEYPSSGGHRPDPDAVVALVEEVSGLLAAHHIGLEVQAVLGERHRLDDRRPEQRQALVQPGHLHLAGQAQHQRP